MFCIWANPQARTGYVSNMVTGTRVEAYATAIGWCLLSGFNNGDLSASCDGVEMVQVTEYTPTDLAMLQVRVNISGPDSGFDFDRIDGFYVPETKATALQIFRGLGCAGPGQTRYFTL